MFVFDCEAGYQPDNGQNDVTDGSVENYDFDWGQPLDTEPLDDALTDDERTEAQSITACPTAPKHWKPTTRSTASCGTALPKAS